MRQDENREMMHAYFYILFAVLCTTPCVHTRIQAKRMLYVRGDEIDKI